MFILPSGRGIFKMAGDIITFTPNGGVSAGSPVALSNTGTLSTSITINCTQPATWIWSGSGGSVSVANNGSSQSITFSLSTTLNPRSASYTVNGTSSGITKYYTVNLTVDGSA